MNRSWHVLVITGWVCLLSMVAAFLWNLTHGHHGVNIPVAFALIVHQGLLIEIGAWRPK